MLDQKIRINLYWVALLIPLLHAFANVLIEHIDDMGAIRALIVLIFLVYFVATRYEWNVPNCVIAIYLGYYGLLIIMQSSSPLGVMESYLRTIIWALMFPIGYYYVRNFKALRDVNSVYILALCVFLADLILANLLGYGAVNYAEDSVSYGGAGIAVTKTMGLILLMAPVILRVPPTFMPIGLFGILTSLSLIFVLLGLKRSALGALVLGGMVYLILAPERRYALLMIGALALVLMATFPVYQDTLMERLDARSSAMDEITGGNLQEEGRFNRDVLPAINLWLEGSMRHKLFGTEIFNPEAVPGGRNMHVDYARNLLGTGLVGLFLFFLVYAAIAFELERHYSAVRDQAIAREIRAVFWALMIAIMVLSYAGTMWSILLRGLLFFYWGAMVGVLRHMALERLSDAKKLNGIETCPRESRHAREMATAK